VGTIFLPRKVSLCSRKHWIAFTKSPKGEIIIDQGAEKALVQKGKSLLPSGIKGIKGRFSMGNSVVLLNEKGTQVAVGMINYHSGDLKKIMGVKTSEIELILGYKHDDEVVHRDNLILSSQIDEGEGEDTCQLNP
jgi:glutamate 5-kinase